MKIHQNSSSFGNWTTSKYHFSVTEATCMKPKVSRKKTEQTLTCSLKCSQISRFFFSLRETLGSRWSRSTMQTLESLSIATSTRSSGKMSQESEGFLPWMVSWKRVKPRGRGEQKVIGGSHRIHVWHIYHPTHWWASEFGMALLGNSLRGDTFLCERSFQAKNGRGATCFNSPHRCAFQNFLKTGRRKRVRAREKIGSFLKRNDGLKLLKYINYYINL